VARTVETGIERFREERDLHRQLFQSSQMAPGPEIRHSGQVAGMIGEQRGRVVDAYEQGEPFICDNYCTAPEIAVAMDLPWFMVFDAPFNLARWEDLPQVIDDADAMGLGTDLCTAVRTNAYYVEHGLVPTPTAAVGFTFPCDGLAMLQQIIQHSKTWKNVPMFCPDPAPYFKGDPRGVPYFANELRKMTAFLEEHTGRKLDMDKLKVVINESNKHYELWLEHNDHRRVVPSPHGVGTGGYKCYAVAQLYDVGGSGATAWFQELIALGEEKVASGIGVVPEEKLRIYWFDIMPSSYMHEFMPWVEQEFGAVIVMDMLGDHAYTTIDTSSEEKIWSGLAKRAIFDTPMVRQAIGTAQGFVNDLVRVVRDFKIDVVVWPGHSGHKEALATFGIVRETCRDLGVHFMEIRMDLWDARSTSPDQIKDKFSQFFQTMGLG
jgi:hypothetical protein